jgi:hypothetical protein
MMPTTFDDVHAKIILPYKEITEEYRISNAWIDRVKIFAIKSDDILNIKGLGSLKVKEIRKYARNYQVILVINVDFIVEWISDCP